jgi:tetratricopeptide (TPR) repeat protein
MSIPDKFHHTLKKLIEQQGIQSQAELESLLNSLVGKPLPELAKEDLTTPEQARELVWEAQVSIIDKGRRLAKKALKLDPDCIEAYEYLGESYQYYYKRQAYFEKGIEIGRRIFGGDFLKANKGHFWHITETRPFMRSLNSLAECYYAPGRTGKAIEIWKELLELNPGDNQGVRYCLLSALLEVKDLETYHIYHKKYKESSAMTLYPQALYTYLRKGDVAESRTRLRAAVKANPHVPPLLFATYPPQEYPYSYMMGSKEEAIIYLHYGWRSWIWAEGAVEWLKRNWMG